MAFVSGVLLAEKTTVVRLIITIAFAGFVLIPLIRQKAYEECAMRCALFLAVGIIGAILSGFRQWQWKCEADNFTDGQTATVCGMIVHKQYKNSMWQYEVQPKGCRYRIIACEAADDESSDSLEQMGYPLRSVLEVKGNFQFFAKPSNEGQFNEFLFQKSKGNIGRIYDAKTECIRSPSMLFAWEERLFVLRRKLCMVYENNLPKEESGILASMAAGERALLSSDVRELFQHSGLSHILAISGMHIHLIGLTVFMTLRKRKCPYLFTSIVAALVLLGYGGMIELGVSSIRAIGMFFIYLIAACMGRRYDAYSSLAMLVILLVLFNPFVLYQTGFIFSCYAALSATVVAGVLKERETREKKFSNTFQMSLLLQLFTLPVVAYFYYEIPLYALAFNLLLLPFLGAVIGIGLVGGLIGVFLPAIAKYLLFPVHMILTVYLWACDLGETLPNETVICARPGVVKLVIYALILRKILLLFSSDKKDGTVAGRFAEGKRERCREYFFLWKQWAIRMISVAILLAVLLYVPGGRFEIHFLDVGQGDGIYLHTTEGANLFIDGGSSSVSGVGTYRMLPFLKYKGVRKIDYWFISHPDADHINGLIQVLQAGYPVGMIITGVRSEEVMEWEKLLELAKEREITVSEMHTGDCLNFKETSIRCLHPGANFETDDLNNASLVLLYEDASMRAVFGGDIPSEVELEIIKKLDQDFARSDDKKGGPSIDLLKMNHHGSKYSNCEEWLTVWSPKIAVISCGRDNRYGHPHFDTLKRLESVHSTVFRTDEMGQICITRNKKGINIRKLGTGE